MQAERQPTAPQETPPAPKTLLGAVGCSLKRLVRRHWPWARIRRLRAALDAATDVGIYPQSVVGGDKPYEKRTEYMEGWNASQMESLREAIKCLEHGDWE